MAVLAAAAGVLMSGVIGIVIGIVIGGLGGGGGVLAVPALVYVLGQSAQDATTSSVIIVGATALAGTLTRLRGDTIDWRTGMAFGVAGLPVAYLGTRLNHAVSQPVLLLAFAGVTIIAATAMLFDRRRDPGGDPVPAGAVATRTRLATHAAKIVVCGGAVGFLTGFLGVGGGFLVVPALVLAMRVPVRVAIGTSLFVITINSTASVATRLTDLHPDWRIIAPFTVAAIAGSVAGKRLAARIDTTRLTTAFAVLLVVVGGSVGVQSLLAL